MRKKVVFRRETACFLALILSAGAARLSALPTDIPPAPETAVIRELSASEFEHQTGRPGTKGWQADYRKDRPGYVLTHLREPLLLEPGFYRATFSIRRGHYPRKGLFRQVYGLFRLEIWDTTDNERLAERVLQICDFRKPNVYEPRWLEFSMRGREGHVLEPRVYWIGLANGEAGDIRIERFSDPSLIELEEKALRLARALENQHLENGFVVSRKPGGEADETGDATTYTGYYACSLAWKYAVTQDELTYQALENALQTLHNSLKGDADHPILTRFVDEEGTPFPKPPSKDVYNAFFLAYAAAFPHIKNPALKEQMRRDMERLGRRYLKDGLIVNGGGQPLVSLTPYFTEAEIRDGIRKLFADKRDLKKAIKILKNTRRYLPFADPLPTTREILRALERQDEEALLKLVVPTINGGLRLAERVRDILREQYRTDLLPKRTVNGDHPGKKLADLLNDSLKKFPVQRNGERIERTSDLKVLASNALISLHIVRTAGRLTQEPTFDEYYKTNLFSQDALLKTALDWFGMEEELGALSVGNVATDRERRGYLALLALANLLEQETNPAVKENYQRLLQKEWDIYRREDNPLVAAFAEAYLKNSMWDKKGSETETILRALSLYPENRVGFGDQYWRDYGKTVAEKFGGGEVKGYTREPLPISHRPKDSFLWQRNARRLRGDYEVTYPGTDYLFVYWFCRHKGIIPSTPPEPSVKR